MSDRRCPYCGGLVEESQGSCSHCGSDWKQEPSGSPEAPLSEAETQVLKAVFTCDETRRLQTIPGPRAAFIEVYGPQGELIDWHRLPPTGTISIGRGSDQMIRIADLTVSRRHAQIQADGGKYYISDMGSLNDTLLNGERIRGQQELFDGARLTIGMHTLVFSYR
jgi:hypothetical protein